jgi:hypothetical protein
MPDIELFRWYLHGRKQPTSWRMTREDALARDPNARPELASREVRTAAPRGNDAAAIVRAGGGAPAGTPK